MEYMEIICLGHSSFKIKSKESSLVTDPYNDPNLGFKFPKTEAGIVTVSHAHDDHQAVNLVQGEPFIITGPGEYEMKGISVFGLASNHDQDSGKKRGTNTIYLIEMEGLRICHLGDLGENLDDKKLEEIDGVDILMVPVGGFFTLDLPAVVELITKIEPLIVIPMHYRLPSMNGDYANLLKLSEFLKAMESEEKPPLPKLIISKDKLPTEREIVVLEKKS